MYDSRTTNPLGCLLTFILLAWVFIKLKLYYVIFFLIFLGILFHIFRKTKTTIEEHKEEQERKFEPEIGETYKVCPYCGNDIKRSTTVCPHCKNKIV